MFSFIREVWSAFFGPLPKGIEYKQPKPVAFNTANDDYWENRWRY